MDRLMRRRMVVTCVALVVGVCAVSGTTEAGDFTRAVRTGPLAASSGTEAARQRLQRFLVANVRRPKGVGPPTSMEEGPNFRMTQGSSQAALPNMAAPMYSPDGALTHAAAERMTADDAMFAGTCKPRLESVALPRDPDVHITYMPPCTEAPRCGGCCTEIGDFRCRVIQMSTEQFEVMMLYLAPGSSEFEFRGFKKLMVDQHVACECQRYTQSACSLPARCHPDIHVINHNNCSCTCKLTRQVAQCQLKGKLWNETQCACVCPNAGRKCSRRRVFDDETCRCVRSQRTARPPVTPVATGCRCPRSHMAFINAAGQCLCRKADWGALQQNTRFGWIVHHNMQQKTLEGDDDS